MNEILNNSNIENIENSEQVENFATPEQQKNLTEAAKLMEEVAVDDNGKNVENNKGYDSSIRRIDGMTELRRRTGFDSNGINYKTGTIYDEEGYDKDGFDEIGIDREGFDRDGFGADDRDREGFDRDGYDVNGYDKRGFDKNGINRETGNEFDKDGFNLDGYDRDGYNRSGVNSDGFDRNGWNRSQRIHKETGTKYGPDGFDLSGYDKDGFYRDGWKHKGRNIFVNKETGTKYDSEGFDWYGYDRDGFNREGFDSLNYGRDGFNKITGINRDGFDRDGNHVVTGGKFNENGFAINHLHMKTGDKFDPEGYDFNGFNKEGFNREGFDRRGIHKETGTKYGPDGFDSRGLTVDGVDREGFKHYANGQISKKTIDGYNRDGFNASGYDRDGFDRDGRDKDGYDRDGLDREGYTREFNAKFNKYGVDENGYLKTGEMDPDLALAIDFAESGAKNRVEFAEQKGLNPQEVQESINFARKKYPNLDEVISKILSTGNQMRYAAVNNDAEKFIDGKISLAEMWEKHPKLNVMDLLESFVSDDEKRRRISERVISELVLDTKHVETNVHTFAPSYTMVSTAIKNVEEFKKNYARYRTDGSPEEIQKKRENTKKLYDMMKYLGQYKNKNLDSLLGQRQSRDGGQTWVEFNGEAIGRAMEALKAQDKLICTATVREYILDHAGEN